ncbi:MAG: carbohydrate ABC transporter permease [Gaiellaceae bacterium]
MLAPYALGLSALVVVPAAATFALALSDWDLIGSPTFVGLGNFRELWHDDVFARALRNSLQFAALGVPLRLLAALGLALLLHSRFRGASASRAAVVVPSIVPDVACGLLWLWLLNPLFGPINLLLGLGGEPERTFWGGRLPMWLTDPDHARLGIVLMALFTIGEGFVILLVVRRAIPDELHELTAVEGASSFAAFRRLTLPLMAPALVLLFCRDTIYSLQATLVPALVVTDGGPAPYATTYVPVFVYRNAFEYLRYGYAASATVVMFALTAAIVLVQWQILRRWRRDFVL